ncbi:hypothetical protein [Liquorilactobacillus mali]|uniref:hypothetical protein n=1 Tax=Liquorilactobacillus mali TaxID=1618 RepID=UPI002955A16B|nr:hypothetical protein [Liquorilactobacillus mali]MDV7758233.1 hypothetical protein [Liquorilactobacillus mali]
MNLLGYEFSSFDLAEHQNPPKLVVKHWSNFDGSGPKISLNAQFSSDQHFFKDLASTEERAFNWYNERDFQELADNFNNDESLPALWKSARREAFADLISFYKGRIKEAEGIIPKYEKELRELEEME